MMRSGFTGTGALALALGMVTACGGERTLEEPDATLRDASPEPDARPVVQPPAGGVGLAITMASEPAAGELRLEVLVSNAEDGEPARLVWSAFSLETDAGAILDADGEEGELCPEGVSVAPGASLGCTVFFRLGSGEPLTLHYRADDERTAEAEVELCSASAPGGLCPVGESCVESACVGPCSPERPDGLCREGASCFDGECHYVCAPELPNGFCEEGICFEGTCDPSCHRIRLFWEDSCFPCFMDLGPDQCPELTPDPPCNDINACMECLTGGEPTCECLASSACGGCEAEMEALLGCIRRECPTCVP